MYMSASPQSSSISTDSTSVHTHLTLVQNIIARMANNSSSCKNWCVTIVAAILVIVADKQKPQYAWLALLPTISFGIVDAYYLAIEKTFREQYSAFVQKLHAGTATAADLFLIGPIKNMWWHRLAAACSFSVWGFYLSVVALVVIAKIVVLG
jgi:hypothetical protein